MARPADSKSVPDPYRLLGVARQATPAEIMQAWRLRARTEHPDARPFDTGAPARFRALADAYEILSDPGRRAAYDRAARVPEPGSGGPLPAAGTAVRVTVLPSSGQPPAAAPAAAPLRAGPARVDPPGTPRARREALDQRARLALLAQVAARYLDERRERPW